jgi:TonB family protein
MREGLESCERYARREASLSFRVAYVQLRLGGAKPKLYCLAMKQKIVATVLMLLALASRSAWADNRKLETQLKADYKGKVLTLRHFYHGDHLKFHSDGSLAADAADGPWTVDGQIAVEQIQLHGGLLEIKGRRIYVIFDSKSKPQDTLTTLNSYKGEDRKDAEKLLRHSPVEIEVELVSTIPASDEVAAALRAVFAVPGDSLMEVVPDYWHKYFAELEGRPYTPSTPAEKVYYIVPRNGVSAPRLTFDPEPEYTDAARKLKYQGTVVLSLVLDAAGTPKDLQITRALGLGLDDRAIDAVRTWKFAPAMKDGVSVPVALSVQVNFRLY